MSNWEGPPTMKSTMLCLALAGKLGNFGVGNSAARSGFSESMPARPRKPSPPDREEIHSRRENLFGVFVDIMARKSPHSTPAELERIEPAFLCPDNSMPYPVPSQWGRGPPRRDTGREFLRVPPAR